MRVLCVCRDIGGSEGLQAGAKELKSRGHEVIEWLGFAKSLGKSERDIFDAVRQTNVIVSGRSVTPELSETEIDDRLDEAHPRQYELGALRAWHQRQDFKHFGTITYHCRTGQFCWSGPLTGAVRRISSPGRQSKAQPHGKWPTRSKP